ncbi:hypothetical protein KP509_17G007200 [Ceratopteris richardii]|uniref:Uncharacterized protein n=1 Tax=Ceratopteris richardii TaxID=49495 RepID=A0A8T2SVP1_CERRI|nr:hypothetical protein KP509_17G007200 [Ceratopteris richardii]
MVPNPVVEHVVSDDAASEHVRNSDAWNELSPCRQRHATYKQVLLRCASGARLFRLQEGTQTKSTESLQHIEAMSADPEYFNDDASHNSEDLAASDYITLEEIVSVQRLMRDPQFFGDAS